MKKLKKIAFVLILFLIIGIQTIVYGKYVIEYTYTIANVNIDRTIPTIELISTSNTNTNYENHANSTHIITATIKITEDFIWVNNFNKDNIKIMIDNTQLENADISIKPIKFTKNYKIHEITMKNLQGNGEIKIEMPEGIIEDFAGNRSEKTVLDTKIQLDNIAPQATVKEERIIEGKVRVSISANEKIRSKEGWEQSQDLKELKNNFPSNINYTSEIIDFAQNSSLVDINVTKAIYLIMKYGSSNNKQLGWLFSDKTSNIAGKDAIEADSNYKTEMIAFHYSGNVEEDFIQIQSYLHTYWGEGKNDVMNRYELWAKCGYNPGINKYVTMKDNSTKKAIIDKIIYLVLGSELVNREGARNNGGSEEDEIPAQIAKQNLFGISGLKFKLKDNNIYTIIYQINLEKYGWQKAASDDEETTYSHSNPIRGYRVVVVPKSEKEEITKMWNKDIGTNKV